jgi:hypothetical protein
MSRKYWPQNVGCGTDDRAGDGIIFGNRLLEKDLQGFPGAAAQIDKELSIMQEVTTKDLRDAEHEMPVRNLFEGTDRSILRIPPRASGSKKDRSAAIYKKRPKGIHGRNPDTDK